MAIKNSVIIPMTSGMNLPANNVIISIVTFPQPQPIYDEDGVYTDAVQRVVNYSLLPYITEAAVTTESDTWVEGSMVAFPDGAWSKEITPAEYTALLSDGSLAEQWLAAEIQSKVGGTSTVIDPY